MAQSFQFLVLSRNSSLMGKKKNRPRRRKPKTKIPSSSATPPPWTELPGDITANILHRLGAVEILESAQKVCTTWRTVCKDPAMWRVIDMKNHGEPSDWHNLEIMCRHAVDRSQGQLIDINIDSFGTDELLHYISLGSSQLRRLKIVSSYDISGEGLSEAVAKFPNLEELHLFFMPSIECEDIESIGHSCPKLKSFILNDRWYTSSPTESNECALAIAKSMHGLRHLKLFGNQMTNDGLLAILDGCPCLESLDLRHCFNVVLEGDLGKRCSQQIKDLQRPSDSTADYEWDPDIYNDDAFDADFSEYSDNYSDNDYEDYLDSFCYEYFSDDEVPFFGTDYL